MYVFIHMHIVLMLLHVALIDSEESFWSGWNTLRGGSGGRRLLIAGCLALHSFRMDLPATRPASIEPQTPTCVYSCVAPSCCIASVFDHVFASLLVGITCDITKTGQTLLFNSAYGQSLN